MKKFIKQLAKIYKNDNCQFIHNSDVPVFMPMAHAKEKFLTGSLFNTIWSKADYRPRNSNRSVERCGGGSIDLNSGLNVAATDTLYMSFSFVYSGSRAAVGGAGF